MARLGRGYGEAVTRKAIYEGIGQTGHRRVVLHATPAGAGQAERGIHQKATLGDAGLAAPVFDWSGRVVGALGLVGPVERLLLPAGRLGRLAEAVRSTAKALSRDLGAGR